MSTKTIFFTNKFGFQIKKPYICEKKIKDMKDIPNDIINLVKYFETNNHQLLIVGGAVRDSLLGITPKDYDLVTDAHPDKVVRLLQRNKDVKSIIEVGKSFGVIIAVVNKVEYEIATFRGESGYSDSRHPDTIVFGDITLDKSRRDLTINALYYNVMTDSIIDLVGGVEDVKNGVIRTVGRAKDRFKEDKLRKLRALRFAIRFGSDLSIEIQTALLEDNSLEGVSPERIRNEFMSTLRTDGDIKKYFISLARYGFDILMFPGITVNAITQTIRRNPIVNLALYTRLVNLDELTPTLKHLTYSLEEIKNLVFLRELSTMSGVDDIIRIKKLQDGITLSELDLYQYQELCGSESVFGINKVLNYKTTVKGGDIIKEGVKPGPEVGRMVVEREVKKFIEYVFLP